MAALQGIFMAVQVPDLPVSIEDRARRNSLSFNYLIENILCILKSQIKVEL